MKKYFSNVFIKILNIVSKLLYRESTKCIKKKSGILWVQDLRYFLVYCWGITEPSPLFLKKGYKKKTQSGRGGVHWSPAKSRKSIFNPDYNIIIIIMFIRCY